MNGNGSVNYVAFTPAGRVLTSGWLTQSPGQSVTLLDVAGDISVVASCGTGAVADITLTSDGTSAFNYASDSTTSGHNSGQVGAGGSTTIASNPGTSIFGDRGSFTVNSSTGLTLDGNFIALPWAGWRPPAPV